MPMFVQCKPEHSVVDVFMVFQSRFKKMFCLKALQGFKPWTIHIPLGLQQNPRHLSHVGLYTPAIQEYTTAHIFVVAYISTFEQHELFPVLRFSNTTLSMLNVSLIKIGWKKILVWLAFLLNFDTSYLCSIAILDCQKKQNNNNNNLIPLPQVSFAVISSLSLICV